MMEERASEEGGCLDRDEVERSPDTSRLADASLLKVSLDPNLDSTFYK